MGLAPGAHRHNRPQAQGRRHGHRLPDANQLHKHGCVPIGIGHNHNADPHHAHGPQEQKTQQHIPGNPVEPVEIDTLHPPLMARTAAQVYHQQNARRAQHNGQGKVLRPSGVPLLQLHRRFAVLVVHPEIIVHPQDQAGGFCIRLRLGGQHPFQTVRVKDITELVGLQAGPDGGKIDVPPIGIAHPQVIGQAVVVRQHLVQRHHNGIAVRDLQDHAHLLCGLLRPGGLHQAGQQIPPAVAHARIGVVCRVEALVFFYLPVVPAGVELNDTCSVGRVLHQVVHMDLGAVLRGIAIDNPAILVQQLPAQVGCPGVILGFQLLQAPLFQQGQLLPRRRPVLERHQIFHHKVILPHQIVPGIAMALVIEVGVAPQRVKIGQLIPTHDCGGGECRHRRYEGQGLHAYIFPPFHVIFSILYPSPHTTFR